MEAFQFGDIGGKFDADYCFHYCKFSICLKQFELNLYWRSNKICIEFFFQYAIYVSFKTIWLNLSLSPYSNRKTQESSEDTIF